MQHELISNTVVLTGNITTGNRKWKGKKIVTISTEISGYLYPIMLKELLNGKLDYMGSNHFNRNMLKFMVNSNIENYCRQLNAFGAQGSVIFSERKTGELWGLEFNKSRTELFNPTPTEIDDSNFSATRGFRDSNRNLDHSGVNMFSPELVAELPDELFSGYFDFRD